MSSFERAQKAALVMALAVAMPTCANAAEKADSNRTADVLGLIAPGTSVRFTSKLVEGRLSGRLLQSDGEALHLLPSRGGPIRVPVASLTTLEMSHGAKRHTLQGMAVGLAVGLLIGAVAEVDEDRCHGRDSEAFCSRSEAYAGGLTGGVMMGAGIGALVKTERWQPIAIDQLRVGLAPLRYPADARGVALVLSW